MEQHIPRSPFATRLSGSARETELRILNIFQGPKKRPPVLIMLLVALAILSCGWLVSCQPREEQPSDSASASGQSTAYSFSLTPERALTMSLHSAGADSQASSSSLIPLQDIMVYEGDILLQTINVPELSASDHPIRLYDQDSRQVQSLPVSHLAEDAYYLYEGLYFMEESALGGQEFGDFNFDGFCDFALPVFSASPHNPPYAFFLWEPTAEEYVFSFLMFAPPALNQEEKLLVEKEYDTTFTQYRYYTFDENGQLELVRQESVSREPVSQPIRNTIKGERLADYNIEYLTDEQRELLADLPAGELPREPVDLWDLRRRDIWRDTLVPLLYDREADVTFYLVVSTPSGDLDDALPAAYAGHSLTPAGIVLRAGDRAVYHPLLLDCWYGPNCWMEIDDFDGDREDELALCLFTGGGTGVWVESLYFFELDTLDYSAPDCSAFGNILVDYDPDAQTASLSLPGSRESLTVDVSNYLPFRGAEVGNQVSYTLVDGQIYCRVMIDFMATVGYEAAATAPVRWDGSQWILGEISLSTLAPN